MTYISLDIQADAEQLIQDVYDDLAAKYPGWEPAAGNFETWLVRVIVYRLVQPLAEMAGEVPEGIFAKYGAALVNVQPIIATSATGETTWTMVGNAGYTIPEGTQVDIPISGDSSVGFRTTADVVVAPGDTTTLAGEVIIEAIEPGEDGNNLDGIPQVVDALGYVSSIELVGTTGGGADDEDPATYLNRLAETLQTLSLVPVIGRDVAILARNIPGVWRAVGLDNFDPDNDDPNDPGTWLTEKHVTVAVQDSAGAACSAPVKAAVTADLAGRREANFVWHVIDPTFNDINVSFTTVKRPGFNDAQSDADTIEAISTFLSPLVWGSRPGTERDWANERVVYFQDVVTVINEVDSVDHYTFLEIAIDGNSLGAADLALLGAAALPRPNDILAV